MVRRKRLQVLLILCLLLGAAVTWFLWSWSSQLTPAEAAIVGIWHTPPMLGGSQSLLVLSPDRSCHVRYQDGTGKEVKARLHGSWRADSGTLVVDFRRWTGWLHRFSGRKSEELVTLAIEDGVLVMGPGKTLHRSPD